MIAQFKSIADQRAAVDSEMKNVQSQLKEVNALIDSYADKRQRVVVSLSSSII